MSADATSSTADTQCHGRLSYSLACHGVLLIWCNALLFLGGLELAKLRDGLHSGYTFPTALFLGFAIKNAGDLLGVLAIQSVLLSAEVAVMRSMIAAGRACRARTLSRTVTGSLLLVSLTLLYLLLGSAHEVARWLCR